MKCFGSKTSERAPSESYDMYVKDDLYAEYVEDNDSDRSDQYAVYGNNRTGSHNKILKSLGAYIMWDPVEADEATKNQKGFPVELQKQIYYI